MIFVTSQVMGFMRCLNQAQRLSVKIACIQETQMQIAIVNMLKAVFSLFKSEKDRSDNYVQLARGNGGEHD